MIKYTVDNVTSSKYLLNDKRISNVLDPKDYGYKCGKYLIQLAPGYYFESTETFCTTKWSSKKEPRCTKTWRDYENETPEETKARRDARFVSSEYLNVKYFNEVVVRTLGDFKKFKIKKISSVKDETIKKEIINSLKKFQENNNTFTCTISNENPERINLAFYNLELKSKDSTRVFLIEDLTNIDLILEQEIYYGCRIYRSMKNHHIGERTLIQKPYFINQWYKARFPHEPIETTFDVQSEFKEGSVQFNITMDTVLNYIPEAFI